jgi:hypothetical protein
MVNSAMVNSTRKRSRTQSAEPRRGLALLLDETDLARPDTRRAALVPYCCCGHAISCCGDRNNTLCHEASQVVLPVAHTCI